MFLRPRTHFCVPEDVTRPLVLIAAGSGISPFIGFLQFRSSKAGSSSSLGPCVVFFGCRHASADYLYEDELAKFETNGICKVVTAFSKDGERVVYVQHRMKENADTLYDLICTKGGSVFVCG
jgi:sulfite reductase alpha subunit-like flavoprotein